MITIVLADDHKLVRQGVRSLLASESDLHIVGETGDGLEVVPLVERLRPDVLLIDLVMPGLSGWEAARQVSQRVPETHIIVLSMHADESYVSKALRSGANGYVLKEADASELMHAIRTVAQGKRFLSLPLTERAIDEYIEKARATPFDPYDALTRREREVLHLAAEGHSNAEIGQRLSISVRTAEKHRASMMRKLGLRNQIELIRFAIRRGIISLESGALPGLPADEDAEKT